MQILNLSFHEIKMILKLVKRVGKVKFTQNKLYDRSGNHYSTFVSRYLSYSSSSSSSSSSPSTSLPSSPQQIRKTYSGADIKYLAQIKKRDHEMFHSDVPSLSSDQPLCEEPNVKYQDPHHHFYDQYPYCHHSSTHHKNHQTMKERFEQVEMLLSNKSKSLMSYWSLLVKKDQASHEVERFSQLATGVADIHSQNFQHLSFTVRYVNGTPITFNNKVVLHVVSCGSFCGVEQEAWMLCNKMQKR
eukprot:TRINITY_DN13081_c0_g1_i2.p1 TRINITY_DN13081_c0_g1~~TRINITY_DN13081_c0_g1_i2.p1  ORF type:complete len:244 (-),score=44.93 TRINITY_DN13081_c0_g1_i2:73-804(-)